MYGDRPYSPRPRRRHLAGIDAVVHVGYESGRLAKSGGVLQGSEVRDAKSVNRRQTTSRLDLIPKPPCPSPSPSTKRTSGRGGEDYFGLATE
jgi:hypothetical protein